MKLPSHQISAFIEVAKTKSFSRAAQSLAVTQSALSQRISHLESDLETTLFIRENSGPVLTTSGEMLLRYCQTAQSLETQVLKQLKSTSEKFAGTFRIAGFSSVMRSFIIPSLASFLRAHSDVICEFMTFEVGELFDVLKSAKADLIVLDYRLNKKGIAEHLLGHEEYIVIESKKYHSPPDLYLDHGPSDPTTEWYFQGQSNSPKNYRRSFMGDVYGVIEGVEQGLGRAVMSKHLIRGNPLVKIVSSCKKRRRDITLNYYEQPFYSELQRTIVNELIDRSRENL